MGRDFEVDGFGFDQFDRLPRRKPAMRYSSTSGGAGTIAANVVAGSVPMATATSTAFADLVVWWAEVKRGWRRWYHRT